MIHLPNLIADLALILGAAAITTLIFKKLKQPLVLGYLIAGILVGPYFDLFPTVREEENIKVWSEIGVIFLLFSLGLEFSFKKLMKVGGSASITAFVEVVVMLALGYGTGQLLGWNTMDSIFLGGVLSISSTTIIIRAFDELGVKGQKFAGLVFGILVVEDLIAIVLLVLLSTLAVSQQFAGTEMLISVVKLVFFLILWFIGGIFFIPTLLKKTKSLMSEETLLVTSLGLCLLMVVLATQVGFSAALGAFIMGSILAETTQAEKIEHLIKSVKDLFGAIFFVSVGMLIDPKMLQMYLGPVILITVITLVGKTLSTTIGAVLSGQPLKSSVQAGMSLAQIGEFSFIIATLGLTLKVTSDFLYPIAVAVSAVTTFTTPYMIKVAEPFYNWLDKRLPEKWKASLSRYSSGAQTISEASDWQIVLKAYITNTVICTVIIVAIGLLSSLYLLPKMNELMDPLWGRIITGIITFLVMMPFLWALAVRQVQTTAFSNLRKQNKYKGPLWLLRIARIGLAVFMIGFMLDRFFSFAIALSVTFVMVVVLVLLSRRIQVFYNRLEDRFFKNFNAREAAEAAAKAAKPDAAVLAPWDAHLASFQVRPEWDGVGKTLEELILREKYGVNIAMIERGERLIPIPPKTERLYPGDRLQVIGTDEQITSFRNYIDMHLPEIKHTRTEVELRRFDVRTGSAVFGKSIRQSGIRELARSMVVGIERGDQRILNPISDTVLEDGDVVWVVGNPKRTAALFRVKGEAPPQTQTA
ncbi:cation:proton antiporter [Chitinophaga niabensis]|uniref:Transporter, CPA2 family n=1 Tax=Chitinophaga niabensis TaxID=536979 RepID=A0A1N6KA48_9BACT|nr:cation:proton antiporter [Chitinophaga niabensis]SIO53197.1 transporter, CPA2 family [Chitinophaga niabensis]